MRALDEAPPLDVRRLLDARRGLGRLGVDFRVGRESGYEKVLIGTRGARETFLRGRKGRAAKNSVLTSGVKQLKC